VDTKLASNSNYQLQQSHVYISIHSIHTDAFSFVNKGAWWEVDLGADVRVARVKIWNGDVPTRLSNSIVSLIDSQGMTQYSYRIGDATGKYVIEFPSVKLRVQLEGTNYLHMREIQVFDKNGLNVALNKVATQSGTTFWGVAGPASDAVNGDVTDFGSFSGYQAGK
jgi:hypothetical protein